MPTALYWPVRRVHITQIFGINPSMYYPMKGHNGIDFRTVFAGITPKGNVHVFPAAAGKVIEVGDQDRYWKGVRIKGVGYGRFVRLQHPDGSQTVYAHLKEWYVKVGDLVGLNTVIGLTDNTGHSTGSHLHFGYRPPNWQKLYGNGYLGYVNPRLLMHNRADTLFL